MTRREKEWAEFFARLASVPPNTKEEQAAIAQVLYRSTSVPKSDLDLTGHGFEHVTPKERARLRRDYLRLTLSAPRHPYTYFSEMKPVERWKEFEASDEFKLILSNEFIGLPRIRDNVRTILGTLLEGRSIDISVFSPPAGELRLKGSAVIEEIPPERPDKLAESYFYSLLRMDPFPWGRCPICERFFAKVKRQRYCSSTCTARGVEAARKGKRTEYMRDYMAKRRERMRKRKQGKGD